MCKAAGAAVAAATAVDVAAATTVAATSAIAIVLRLLLPLLLRLLLLLLLLGEDNSWLVEVSFMFTQACLFASSVPRLTRWHGRLPPCTCTRRGFAQ